MATKGRAKTVRKKHASGMWLSLWIVIVLVIAIAGALVVWGQPRREPPYSGPTQNISTGVIGEYAALVWIAKDKGYFAANGLNVTIKQYGSGPASLRALLDGQVDTAVASDFAGVSASFQSSNLRLLGNLSTSQAFYLIGRKDHGLKSTASLAGKRIGITNATVGQLYLSQFLALNNLASNSVVTVNMTQADLLTALSKGTIDAAVLFQPNAYSAQKALGAQAATWSIQAGQSIYSSLYGTNQLVHAEPAALTRYMNALLQAQEFIQKHNDVARATIAAQLNYSTDYMNAVWPHFTFTLSLSQELLLNMENEALWITQNHLVTATQTPNYLQMMYFNAMENADPGAISVIH